MIHNAIRKAYEQLELRNWDKIYVALDIHGTVADSDYHSVSSELYRTAIEPLREISGLPEVSIILFSCCYETDYEHYVQLFAKNGIRIDGFNKNSAVPNTKTGCFDSKFYFNILIDDKAGFDPWMWPSVRDAFLNARQFNKRAAQLEAQVETASYELVQRRRDYVSMLAKFSHQYKGFGKHWHRLSLARQDNERSVQFMTADDDLIHLERPPTNFTEVERAYLAVGPQGSGGILDISIPDHKLRGAEKLFGWEP